MNNDANNILPDGDEAAKLELLQALNDDVTYEHSPDAEDLFITDAKEGLQQMTGEKIKQRVHALNADLTKKLHKKKRKKRGIPDQSGTYIIIITILLLIILAYIIVKKMHHPAG